MLDIGWSELLVVAVVLIVVVGPKDLPPMLRAFGKMTARLRAMAGEFRTQFDEALKESELDEVRKTIGDAQRLNPMNTIREAMNPLRQTANEIKADLQAATSVARQPGETKPPASDAAQAETVSATPAPEGDVALPPLENQPSIPAEVAAPAPAVSQDGGAVPHGDALKKDGA